MNYCKLLMPGRNANFRCSSSPSLESFQNLQKLQATFFRETANYKTSIQRLLSASKITLQDEPAHSEFFTYFATASNSAIKKPNEKKPLETQSRVKEFLKNCILPSQLFSCEPKTQNKACMCKPIRRDNANIAEANNYVDEREINREQPVSSLLTEEETGDENEQGNVRKPPDQSSNLHPTDHVNNRRQSSVGDSKRNSIEEGKPRKISKELKPENKKKTADDLKNGSGRSKNESDASNQLEMLENSNEGVPKFILHLPIDLSQFYQPTSEKDMKIVFCNNKKKVCNCESCGSIERPKHNKRKSKGFETDKLFVDGETTVEDIEIGVDNKGFRKEDHKKSKKKWYSCLSFCKKKSKNSENQTEYSKNVEARDKSVDTVHDKSANHVGNSVSVEVESKSVEKCCRCNKCDPSYPKSGDQFDTLKLMIKMEAKQNYRQINNIIKELNEQQDDIKKLREIYAKLSQHFPKLLKNTGAGEDISSRELKENVKTLFGMYKDLSVKIKQIERLSSTFVKNNEISGNITVPAKQFTEDGQIVNILDAFSEPDANSILTDQPGVDYLPEKLNEIAPTKKQHCPCEINEGLYDKKKVK